MVNTNVKEVLTLCSKYFKPEYLANYTEMCTTKGFEFEAAPYSSTFIQFAREDLEKSQDLRATYNAVSNAKRALHRRVDMLCSVLSYDLFNGKRNNFPTKLDFLEKCGVFTPQIISRLNRIRNKLEHDYATLEYKEAENYVDIIELFLVATSIFLKNYPEYIEFKLMHDEDSKKLEMYTYLPQWICVDLSLKEGYLEISLTNDNAKYVITPKINDENYFIWVKQIMHEYFWY